MTQLVTTPVPAVSALRRDPYRLFFPLGVLLGWVGVGQWLLFSLGLDAHFRTVFHAMVQVQGFLGCFVAGFLFTFIPRRTMTGPAAAWQLAVVAACPLLLAAFAWNERWAISQIFWLIELGVLLQFVISRARRSRNPLVAPASLLWIPLGLGCGLGGALITPFPGLHDLGRALVLEGMVSALVMGIGAMLVPVVTRGEPPPPGANGTTARILQLGLAVAFLFSFGGAVPPRLAYAVRFAVALWVLVRGARLWKRPTQPGLNRRIVWLAAWGLPLGYGLLTAWPAQRSAGLHVIFIGGFGLLALAIGQHVVAAHSGHAEWLAARPAASWAVAGLMTLAGVARVAMQLDAAHYLGWMSLAAAAFLAAGAAWLWGMAPMLRA